MEMTIVSLLFPASAPIALMPSAIAALTKNKYRIAIIGVNVLVWLDLYSLVASGSGVGFVFPVPLALALWLILLKVAISTEKASEQGSAAGGNRSPNVVAAENK